MDRKEVLSMLLTDYDYAQQELKRHMDVASKHENYLNIYFVAIGSSLSIMKATDVTLNLNLTLQALILTFLSALCVYLYVAVLYNFYYTTIIGCRIGIIEKKLNKSIKSDVFTWESKVNVNIHNIAISGFKPLIAINILKIAIAALLYIIIQAIICALIYEFFSRLLFCIYISCIFVFTLCIAILWLYLSLRVRINFIKGLQEIDSMQ